MLTMNREAHRQYHQHHSEPALQLPDRREERERNQRERQQVSRPQNDFNVSDTLFPTPIKKEKLDETSKIAGKILGDFGLVSKILMGNDHKQIIGISTHEIAKENKIKGSKAKIESILKEMRGLPPVTGLDESDHDSNQYGVSNIEFKASGDQFHPSHGHHRSRDERSSSGVSEDESALPTIHRKSGYLGNRTVMSSQETMDVNQSIPYKRARKSSENNHQSSHPRHHHRSHQLSRNAEHNVLNLSANESSSDSSPSSSSDSDSSGSSSSSENESAVDSSPKSLRFDPIDEYREENFDKNDLNKSSPPINQLPEAPADHANISWSLGNFMVKTTAPSKAEDKLPSSERMDNADECMRTINEVAAGNYLSSPDRNRSPSSSPSQGTPSPPEDIISPKPSPIPSSKRKTNNSLSASPLQIASNVINKSSKQLKSSDVRGAKGTPTKGSSSVDSRNKSDQVKSRSSELLESSPLRLGDEDCGASRLKKSSISLGSSENKSKSRSPAKVNSSKLQQHGSSLPLPSKENHEPRIHESSGKRSPLPTQLICTIDCHLLKRLPKGLNIKRGTSEVPLKKEKNLKGKSFKRERNGHLASSSHTEHDSPKQQPLSPSDNKCLVKNESSSPSMSFSIKHESVNSPPSIPPLSLAPHRSLPLTTQPGTVRALPFVLPGPPITTSGPSSQDPDPTVTISELSVNDNPEVLLNSAKKLKHDADGETDRVAKLCKYFEAVLSFLLYGNAVEQRGEYHKVSDIHGGTIKLLSFVVSSFAKNCPKPAPANDNKLMALGYRCESLLHLKMYRLRMKELNENNKIIKNVNPDLSSRPGEVVMPASLYACIKKQLSLYKELQCAHDYWNMAEVLCGKYPSCKAFFDTLDKECSCLTITSSFDNLVTYVRTGIKLVH